MTQTKTKKPRPRGLYGVGLVLVLLVVAGLGVYWSGWVRHDNSKSVATTVPITTTKSLSTAKLPVKTVPRPLPTLVRPVHDYVLPPVKNEEVPILRSIPTKEPVVFLTIDDGIVTNPSDVQVMQTAHAKATFFLVYRFIKNDPGFFMNLAHQTGSDIENHSYDHYQLTALNYDQQQQDICKNADIFAQWFGARPILFRPSGGAYNSDTLRAAAACNMKALVLWDVTVNNGSLQYQVGHSLRAGDIVLMHFRKTFQEDLNAFAVAAKMAGLQPDLLINWQ